ncbi:MAG: hypothetical protein AAB569_03740 [Patescibacteria group bacterium]
MSDERKPSNKYGTAFKIYMGTITLTACALATIAPLEIQITAVSLMCLVPAYFYIALPIIREKKLEKKEKETLPPQVGQEKSFVSSGAAVDGRIAISQIGGNDLEDTYAGRRAKAEKLVKKRATDGEVSDARKIKSLIPIAYGDKFSHAKGYDKLED